MNLAAAAQAPLPLPPAPPDRSRAVVLPLLVSTLLFAFLSTLASALSTGFLEGDSCVHYIYARSAMRDVSYFADIWGRPLCTGLYALPAYFGGRGAVHVVSLALALAVAGVAHALAKRQGYRTPALAFVFTLAQPLLFLHSFAELTELPFAALLGFAFLAYQRRRFAAMAVLVSLSPLSRPEGFGFLLLAALALVVHRRWLWLLVLPAPLLVWSYLGYAVAPQPLAYPWWRWLVRNWPYAADSVYPPGYLVHFLVLLPVVTSPLLFPAMLLGVWKCFKEGALPDGPPAASGGRRGSAPGLAPAFPGGTPPAAAPQSRARAGLTVGDVANDAARRDPPDRAETPATDPHLRQCQWLVAAIPLLILVVHSLLYWRGKMASSGEVRYMLVVAPFWALLSAKGWEWAFARFRFRRPLVWAGVAALLPGLANNHYHLLPLDLSDDWTDAERLVKSPDFDRLKALYPSVLVSHPGFMYFLDTDPRASRMKEWKRDTALRPPDGTVLVWDSTYGITNSDANRLIHLEDIKAGGWVEQGKLNDLMRAPTTYRGQVISKLPDKEGRWPWYVFLSPRDKDGNETKRE